MGKALSFLVAFVDLGILGLLVTSRHSNTLSDLGLFGSFIVTALLAWVIALCTALVRAVLQVGGVGGWRALRLLLMFFWLPALPALVYGMSGLRSLFVRGKNSKSDGMAQREVVLATAARLSPPAAQEREDQRARERVAA